jgi:hypothetical protein
MSNRSTYIILISIVLLYSPLLRGLGNNPVPDIQGVQLSSSKQMNPLEDILSIPNYDPTKAQKGLNVFTLWHLSSPEVEQIFGSMIVITDMEGNIKLYHEFPGQLAWDPEFINSTTLVHILASSNLRLLNIQTETTEILPIRSGHHDVEYNPITDTFLTVYFTQYGEYLGDPLLFDDIYEYDCAGNEVWFWNSSLHIPFDESLFSNESFFERFQWTHANTIFWDVEEHAIYYNARHLDTFYKIDYPSGDIIWAAGKLGDFQMFDRHGNEKESLFYHGHAVEPIGPNQFILFDNDYFNTTRENPVDSPGISRMLEVVIDEESMTMNETWSWAAPAEYFCEVWGDADLLPNGNRLGTFGVPAYITEVDPKGDIVWELAVEQGIMDYLGVYNADRFFELPLVHINQTDYFLTPDEDLVFQVKTWDTFDTRIARNGVLTITEGNKVLLTVDFAFQPHWIETIINVNVSSLGNGGRTLNLAITNEDGLKTNIPIIINGGYTSFETSSRINSTTTIISTTIFQTPFEVMISSISLLWIGVIRLIRLKRKSEKD